MRLSARTFVHEQFIYVVVSTIEEDDNASHTITDHYTLSFVCEDLEDDLYQTNLLIWRTIFSEMPDKSDQIAARYFIDYIKWAIIKMGYFPIIEEGMCAPLNSRLALDMAAAA